MRIACIPLASDLEIANPYWPTALGTRPRPEAAVAAHAVAERTAAVAWPADPPWCRLVVMSSSRGQFALCMWAIAIGPVAILLPQSSSPNIAIGYDNARRGWLVLQRRRDGAAHHQHSCAGIGEALSVVLPLVLGSAWPRPPGWSQDLAPALSPAMGWLSAQR